MKFLVYFKPDSKTKVYPEINSQSVSSELPIRLITDRNETAIHDFRFSGSALSNKGAGFIPRSKIIPSNLIAAKLAADINITVNDSSQLSKPLSDSNLRESIAEVNTRWEKMMSLTNTLKPKNKTAISFSENITTHTIARIQDLLDDNLESMEHCKQLLHEKDAQAAYNFTFDLNRSEEDCVFPALLTPLLHNKTMKTKSNLKFKKENDIEKNSLKGIRVLINHGKEEGISRLNQYEDNPKIFHQLGDKTNNRLQNIMIRSKHEKESTLTSISLKIPCNYKNRKNDEVSSTCAVKSSQSSIPDNHTFEGKENMNGPIIDEMPQKFSIWKSIQKTFFGIVYKIVPIGNK